MSPRAYTMSAAGLAQRRAAAAAAAARGRKSWRTVRLETPAAVHLHRAADRRRITLSAVVLADVKETARANVEVSGGRSTSAGLTGSQSVSEGN